MLQKRGVTVSSSTTPDSDLPRKPGTAVAEELIGRPLLRYLRREDVRRYIFGDQNRHCTTPTPYSVNDLPSFLALPDAISRRTHCLLLDPSRIPEILGPRFIAWGSGIEYILPGGFGIDALVTRWALEVK